MDNCIFLRRLFEGYVRNFRSFNWHTSSNYSDFTAAELNFFANLGVSLGYFVRREMNWHFPRDLCWVLGEDRNKEAYLYMERENKDARMPHTIDKMLHKDNARNVPLLVASFGHLKPESFKVASQKLSEGLAANQNALLFAWVGEHENAASFEVKAHVISKGGIEEFLATPYIGTDGYWNIGLNYEQSV